MRRRPGWGIVSCPDGPRTIDLDAMRIAMTRRIVARRLTDPPVENLGDEAGLSRSTVSRMLNGRPVRLETLLASLAVLGLTFEEVVTDRTSSAEGTSET